MNLAKLKGKMAETGVSQRKMSKIIGISTSAVSSKMTGKSEFTAKEILKIIDALHITDPAEKCDIFLSACPENGTKR